MSVGNFRFFGIFSGLRVFEKIGWGWLLEVEFLFDFVGESFDEGPLYAVVFDG